MFYIPIYDLLEGFSQFWRQRVKLPAERIASVIGGGLLLGTAVLFGILGYIPQVRELFKVLLEADSLISMQTVQAVLAALAMMLLSAMLFFAYRYFLPYLGADGEFDDARVQTIAYVGLYGIAAAPWLACIASVISMKFELAAARDALGKVLADALDKVPAQPALKTGGAAALDLMARVEGRAFIAAAVIALLGVFTLSLLAKSTSAGLWRVRSGARWAVIVLAGIILIVLGFASILADLLATLTPLYQWMGTLATGILAAIGLFTIGLAVAGIAQTSGLATYFGALILILFVWLGTAAGNYLAFHGNGTPQLKPTPPLEFDVAAKEWLNARRAAIPASAPVPAFVVSAQGGGMYAATASALFLTRLQEKEPAFRDSIFAISAVSGGSIGAGFYYALSAAGGCGFEGPSGEDAVRSLVLTPYLAAIAGNVPADILRKLALAGPNSQDRADAFTGSLLDSCPILRQPYASHWTGKNGGPALVLNTTWMSNGHRVAFAPFSLKKAGDGTLWSMGDVYKDQAPRFRGQEFHPRLADAIAASARFPGALPPLSLTMGKTRHNYGDGGYADASGVTTALEIFEALKTIADEDADYKEAHIEPRLVMITFDYEPVTPAKEHGTSFADIWAPVSAILGVRFTESGKAIARAEKRSKDLENGRFLRISLNPDNFGVALGLQMSRTSYEVLSLLLGRAEWCPPNYSGDNQILINSCVAQKVREAIHPGSGASH